MEALCWGSIIGMGLVIVILFLYIRLLYNAGSAAKRNQQEQKPPEN